MGIFVEITKWVLLFSAVLCFLEAMYRIATEEDKCKDWKTEGSPLCINLYDFI